MTRDTSGGTSENGLELFEFLVIMLVFLFNPVLVILVGMMWLIPMFVPFTVLEQPIVRDMMCIGMIQYLELWLPIRYLVAVYFDLDRQITPRDVGTVLLGAILRVGVLRTINPNEHGVEDYSNNTQYSRRVTHHCQEA
jgi:hypothetical protein